MPTPTYTAISKQVLTSAQSSVTFSSIPQNYADLLLTISARSSSTSATYDGILVQINSLTSGNTYAEVFGYTTGVLSARNQYGATKNFIGWLSTSSTTTNTFGSSETYFPNYAGSTNKILSSTAISENNATTSEAAYAAAIAGLSSNTSAISSLTLNFSGGNFVSGSRFDLYGISSS
jgi:hypothetical protein